MHNTVQVQLPMPSTMCSPDSSTWQDKKQVMHDTVQVHVCLCPAPPPDTGQKAGHAWHSPGTTPCALLTPPPDTGQKAGHAWQHSPGTAFPVPSVTCSPDSSTRHRIKRSTSFIWMQESFWWWHCYSIRYSLPLPPPPGISVPTSISLEKIQRWMSLTKPMTSRLHFCPSKRYWASFHWEMSEGVNYNKTAAPPPPQKLLMLLFPRFFQ